MARALVIGSIVVISSYMLYYVGLFGILNIQSFIDLGDNAVYQAVINMFGSNASKLLMLFVVISCMGTLNGLTLACIRGLYTLFIRFEKKSICQT